MDIAFEGEVWHWEGPAPYYFVTVPEGPCSDLKAVAASVTYGWGMVPVMARIGGTEWKTSLFPKDGRYIVPLRDSVRTAERIREGDRVTIALSIRAKP